MEITPKQNAIDDLKRLTVDSDQRKRLLDSFVKKINTGKTVLCPSKRTVDDRMCATLEFDSDILKLQVAEDKHAIYPTAACKDDVSLVLGFFGEDCGGKGPGRRLGSCNAGRYPEGETGCHTGCAQSVDDLFSTAWGGKGNNESSHT